MKNIKLSELSTNYNADTLTCFEKPLAVIMKNENEMFEDLFILLTKVNGIYMSEIPYKDLLVRDLYTILGFKMYEDKYSINVIEDLIDSNVPVIVGLDLYTIFMNDNYQEKHWPHWCIINGVYQEKNIVRMFDNFYFNDMSHKYEELNFDYKIIKESNKSYIKKYDKPFSFYYIINEKNKAIKDILIEILDKIVYLSEMNVPFKQLEILRNINLITKNQLSNESELVEESKKKLININKYRQTVFNLIIKKMNAYKYSEAEIEHFQDNVAQLEKSWENFILVEIIKSLKYSDYDLCVPEEINNLSKSVTQQIKKFKEYIEKIEQIEENNTVKKTNYEDLEFSQLIVENNNDDLISYKNNIYGFHFNTSKIYNWWNMNDSPKVIIKENIEINKIQTITCEIESQTNFTVGNFMVGVFIRDRNDKNNCYMFGIEDNKYLSLDKVGFMGYKKEINFEENKVLTLFCKIESNTLTVGYKDSSISMDLSNMNYVDIGITCKTWESGGAYSASIQNIEFES